MAIRRNNLMGPAGTTVTTANMAAYGDPFTGFINGTAVYLSGGGMRLTLGSGQTYGYYTEDQTAARYVAEMLAPCPVGLTAETGMMNFNSSGARCGILIGTDYRPRIAVGSTGVTATKPTNPLVQGQMYLWGLAYSPGSSVQFRIANPDGSLVWECTPQTTALTGLPQYRFIGAGNAAGPTTQDAINVQAGPLDTGWIGPYPAINANPVANAGANQTNIEPGTLITTGGTDTDSDGTIASRAWTQIGGPSVTLSSTTGTSTSFVAPATRDGGTVVLRKTVTDDQGATGTADVTIAVLPASRWTRTSSGMQPTYRMTA